LGVLTDVKNRTEEYNVRDSLEMVSDSTTFSTGVAVSSGSGCTLNRREGQRFFSSLVNGPRRS